MRQIEGEKHVYESLEEYKKRAEEGKRLPFMVDAEIAVRAVSMVRASRASVRRATIRSMRWGISKPDTRAVMDHGQRAVPRRSASRS